MAARVESAGAGVRDVAESRTAWIAVAGAVVTLVAFVLPWMTLNGTSYSGLALAGNAQRPQPGVYLLAVAAVVALMACAFWLLRTSTRRAAMVVLAAGVVGLLVVLMYGLSAVLQPTLSGWVSGVTTGTSKPNPNIFGLGEFQGLGAGLLVALVGTVLTAWAGWAGAREAGGLAVAAPAPEMEMGGNPVVRRVVVAGLLGAVAALLAITGLGRVPFPTGVPATIMHVPAIIGGIAAGWPVGWAIGTIFGLYSFLVPSSPLFADPLVAIVPRMFIGITAYFTYRALRGGNYTFALVAASVVGTLTNTILVLGSAAILHPDLMNPATALVVGITNGIPEAIIAPIIVLPVMDAISGRTRARKSTI